MLSIKDNLCIGDKIIYLKKPYIIEYIEFIKPGKGKSFIRTKIRNLITNKLIIKVFKSFNNIKLADVIFINCIFLYFKENFFFFFKKENFEQIVVSKVILFKKKKWLIKEYQYKIVFWNNYPIDVLIPNFIYLKVIDNYWGIEKESVKNKYKLILLNNNIFIKVPRFINIGDFIKVNTKTETYISRK